MRALLLRLSESKRLAPLMMRNGVSRRVARRFVAGEKLEDALEAAREVNRALQLASLDLLGENVSDEAGARRAADEYIAIFDRIAQEHLDANVSLKLTQLGLDLSEDLCQELLEKIVAHAADQSNFVRVDMEGSAYTQRTVEIVKRVRSEYSNVGTVMQAYLYRTEQDVRDLVAVGCRLRLCKGAYQEPPEVAFPKKADVDANYVKLTRTTHAPFLPLLDFFRRPPFDCLRMRQDVRSACHQFQQLSRQFGERFRAERGERLTCTNCCNAATDCGACRQSADRDARSNHQL